MAKDVNEKKMAEGERMEVMEKVEPLSEMN